MRIVWKDNYITYIKLFLVALFFGSTYISGRILSANLPTFTSAFLRFLLASLFLSLIVIKIFGRIPTLTPQEIYLVIFLALTGVVGYNLFFFSGLKFVTASRASMIIALNPSFITLLSALVFKERFNHFNYAGIFLSLIGVSIVISQGNLREIFLGKIGYGELLLLGCVICWSSFTIMGKVVMSRFNLKPIVVITYACIIGTLILALPAYLEGQIKNMREFTWEVWISLIVLGLFGTVLAFIWFYQGVEEIGPSRASIFINLVPIFATLIAVLILGEKLSSSLLIGAVLVVSGVYINNYPPKR